MTQIIHLNSKFPEKHFLSSDLETQFYVLEGEICQLLQKFSLRTKWMIHKLTNHYVCFFFLAQVHLFTPSFLHVQVLNVLSFAMKNFIVSLKKKLKTRALVIAVMLSYKFDIQ